MATIVTLASSDLISNSRADLNTNFSNLNSDKIETSTLDTDTTLAANSDAKIATQKAVKAYVDAGGNSNASTTARGVVEEATEVEVGAGTGTGATGARLFTSPSSGVLVSTVSSAELLALFATPKVLIAAQGAGTIIQLDSCLMKYVYNSVQYTLGGAIQLNWVGGSTSVMDASSTMLSGADIQAAASKTIRGRVADLGITVTTFENTGIQITNAGEAFASGNGTIKVYLTYRIITI